VSEQRSVSLAALIAVMVVALDQATKAIVRDQIPRGDQRDLILGAHLVHIENDGVAFGRLGGSGVLVALVVAAAVIGVVVYFARHRTTPLIWLPTGLLLGGAAGNILDRLSGGAVTDFIKLPHWPAFNVADIAVTAGVILLLIVIELDARRQKRAGEAADGGADGDTARHAAPGDGAAGRA
jgi:signal peptidase II